MLAITDVPLRRRRGRRGGVRQRARRRGIKLPMPSIIFGNAESVRNKTDEFESRVKCTRDFRDANIIGVSETFLTEKDSTPDLPGFSCICVNRNALVTGENKGGGVCIYVNNRWCTNITIKREHCCQDIELLCVGLRPFYLPREFQRVFVTVVYIHPRANTKLAAEVIRQTLSENESECPDSIRVVLGDFNQCRLNKVLPQYRQYVTCTTCRVKENTLDLCHGNIPHAYKCRSLPGLGRSKHNFVQLIPKYKQQLKRSKPEIKIVKQWGEGTGETLEGCFMCTDWESFIETSSTLNEAVEVTQDYINFCVEMIVPQKVVKIFPNTKPWVNKDLVNVVRERQEKWQEGDIDCAKQAQKNLNTKIRENKTKFKNKVQDSFNSNNSREFWQGVNTMTGYKPAKKTISTDDPGTLANELNSFYARFDNQDFHKEQAEMLNALSQVEGNTLVISEDEVRNSFQNLNIRSACGPDNISGLVLKKCSSSLSPVFAKLFQKSLDSSQVPVVWKTSSLVPVPKNRNPKEKNDYRPVALTS